MIKLCKFAIYFHLDLIPSCIPYAFILWTISILNTGSGDEDREGTTPVAQYSTRSISAKLLTPRFLEQHQAVCTACRVRIEHLNPRKIRLHPGLRTLVCTVCSSCIVNRLKYISMILRRPSLVSGLVRISEFTKIWYYAGMWDETKRCIYVNRGSG